MIFLFVASTGGLYFLILRSSARLNRFERDFSAAQRRLLGARREPGPAASVVAAPSTGSPSIEKEMEATKAKLNESLRKIAQALGSITGSTEALTERIDAIQKVNDSTRGELERFQGGYDAHRIREFHFELFRLFDFASRKDPDLAEEIETLLFNHGIERIPHKTLRGTEGKRYAEFENAEPGPDDRLGDIKIVRDAFWTRSGEAYKVLREGKALVVVTSGDQTAEERGPKHTI